MFDRASFTQSILEAVSDIRKEQEAKELEDKKYLEEQIAFQKKLTEGIDITAPQSGILYSYQTDKEGVTSLDIIDLPEYLSTWESFIEEINIGEIKWAFGVQ